MAARQAAPDDAEVRVPLMTVVIAGGELPEAVSGLRMMTRHIDAGRPHEVGATRGAGG